MTLRQAGSTLHTNGFRFCCDPERTVFRWIDPVLLKLVYTDWIDTTDMSDAEFDAFATAE